MRGDSPEARGLCLPKIHYFIFDHHVPTDKMAEKNITLAEKWQTKIWSVQKKVVPLQRERKKEILITKY